MTTISARIDLAQTVISMAIALNKLNRGAFSHMHHQSNFLRDFGTVFLNLGQRSGTLSAARQIKNSVSFLLEPGDTTFFSGIDGVRVEMPEYNLENDWQRIEDFLAANADIEVIFIEGARPDYQIGNWQQLHTHLGNHLAHLRSDLTFVIV